MLASIIDGIDPCLLNAMDAAAPAFWIGMVVLFLLVLYRTNWNFREAFSELVSFRQRGNQTKLEKGVLAATLAMTFYLLIKAMEGCGT
ncbi:hypothetical protein [Falsiruegeria litorea]|uniref:hypothetical protein n=1 Tax=Falsiruegeria litorea TaxID=1280831 RepID=UPI001054DAB9|nr:hypothetical protein [Falsiruegeria litorea]